MLDVHVIRGKVDYAYTEIVRCQNECLLTILIIAFFNKRFPSKFSNIPTNNFIIIE